MFFLVLGSKASNYNKKNNININIKIIMTIIIK